MHRRRPLLLVTLALLAAALPACGEKAARGRSQDDVARVAFDALRQGDPAPLLEVMLRPADLQRLAETRGVAPRSDLEALAQGGRDQGREAFEKARAASAAAVDWPSATFGGVLEGPSVAYAEDGVTRATTVFAVQSTTGEAVFTLGGCLLAADGWRVSGPLRFVENPHGGDVDPLELMTDLALRNLAARIGAFYAQQKRLPERLEELSPPPAEGEEAAPPAPLTDARGAPIAWRVHEDGKWELRSPGPDGKLDTDDDRVFTRDDMASPHGR